jgi:hypothetical protein
MEVVVKVGAESEVAVGENGQWQSKWMTFHGIWNKSVNPDLLPD